jgi:hypothetical protein
MTPVLDPPKPKPEVKPEVPKAPKPPVNETAPDENPLLRKIRELKAEKSVWEARALANVSPEEVDDLKAELAKTKALLKEIEALL